MQELFTLVYGHAFSEGETHMFWKPAATPPTTDDLVLTAGNDCWIIGYHEDGHWYDTDGFEVYPDYWMPLPPPPQSLAHEMVAAAAAEPEPLACPFCKTPITEPFDYACCLPMIAAAAVGRKNTP